MAGITLAQAQTKLDAWLTAEAALATSQSYTMSVDGSSRSLTRANLREVRETVKYWDNKVKELTAAARGRNRTRYVVLG